MRLGFYILFNLATLVITSSVMLTPVSAQGFSVSFGDLEFQAQPGETIHAEFMVSNQSGEPKTVRIYSGDWVRMEGDVTKYEFSTIPGEEERSLLKWMTFSPDQMVLAPDESRDVYCDVTFPDDPTLEGSYWGVIFVEEVPVVEAPLESPDNDVMQVGIATIFRYAVKIYTTFEGTDVLSAKFADLHVTQADGGYDVAGIFENSGNVYIRPDVWLEIRDISGEVLFTQTHERQTVLPESTHLFIFSLRDLELAPGSYLVMVIADYGGTALTAAQARMELVEGQAEPVN